MLQDLLLNKVLDNTMLGQKIQNRDDISIKKKYALDATEKNPNIEGTIAEKIDKSTDTINQVKSTIENLIALPSGASTAADAEIAAAKTGIKGETYNTLQGSITGQIQKYRDVKVSNEKPAVDDYASTWINTSINEETSYDYEIPQIKDTEVTKYDTWSSRKINDELDTINDEMIVVNDRDTTNNVTDKTKLVIGLNNEEVELVTMEEFNELKEIVSDIENLSSQSFLNLNYELEMGAINGTGEFVYGIDADPNYYKENSTRTKGYIKINNDDYDSIRCFFYWKSGSILSPGANGHRYLNINFYDEDYEFISRSVNYNTHIIDVPIPDNSVFISVSFTYTNFDDVDKISLYCGKPSELMVKFNTIEDTIDDIKICNTKRGLFMGDSISFGLYSYFDENGLRKNGDDDTSIIADTRCEKRISDWFSDYYYNVPMDNIAERGTGYVADSRGLGNSLVKARKTDFSKYNFVALCFGVNDYIQKKSLGSLSDIKEGTVIGNMVLTLKKIYGDNPLCKVVVFTPYNTWGQYRDSESSGKVLYGDESTNYALGYDMGAGITLQDVIDALNSVCKFYGIECIDLSQGNYCNRLNIKDILVDGLHPRIDAMQGLASEMFFNMTFR